MRFFCLKKKQRGGNLLPMHIKIKPGRKCPVFDLFLFKSFFKTFADHVACGSNHDESGVVNFKNDALEF